MTLSELDDLLAAWGSDPARWPAARRPAAQALLAEDSRARRLHEEARALDRLLTLAPTPDSARLATLEDRILAAARDEVGGRAAVPAAAVPVAAGNVVPLPARTREGKTRTPVAAPAALPDRWRAAAAIAASLVIGIGIGLTDLTPAPPLSLASITSTSGDAEAGFAALPLDSLTGPLDEDHL
jgi:hypothetical protein